MQLTARERSDVLQQSKYATGLTRSMQADKSMISTIREV